MVLYQHSNNVAVLVREKNKMSHYKYLDEQRTLRRDYPKLYVVLWRDRVDGPNGIWRMYDDVNGNLIIRDYNPYEELKEQDFLTRQEIKIIEYVAERFLR